MGGVHYGWCVPQVVCATGGVRHGRCTPRAVCNSIVPDATGFVMCNPTGHTRHKGNVAEAQATALNDTGLLLSKHAVKRDL